MRILAIDTALGACSVCIATRGQGVPLAEETLAMERGHAEALVPMVERVVAASGDTFEALDRIAVTVGPGSFTGLRVGIAAARAAGLALGRPVIGVSTLSAFLAPLLATQEGRVIAAAIDARHGNIYVQAQAPGGRMLIAPRIMALREATRALGSGPVALAGPGAALLAQDALIAGLDARVVDASAAPDIAWVARLGLAADPASAPPDPIYLRAPDAAAQDHRRLPRR